MKLVPYDNHNQTGSDIIEALQRGRQPQYKFVMVDNNGAEPSAIVFSGIKHYPAYVDYTGDTAIDRFLGAGMGTGSDVEYGSASFEQLLGRSSVEDPAKANQLLSELRSALYDLMRAARA